MRLFVNFAMFIICLQKFTAAKFLCGCVFVCACVGNGTSGLNARQQRKFAKSIYKYVHMYVCIYTHAYLQCIHTHMRIFGKFANLRFVAKASKFCVTQNVQLIEIVSLYLLICSYLGMFGFLLLPQRLADIHICFMDILDCVCVSRKQQLLANIMCY